MIKRRPAGWKYRFSGDVSTYKKGLFKENVHPAFYIINSDEELLTEPYYFDLSVNAFGNFLKKGISEYK